MLGTIPGCRSREPTPPEPSVGYVMSGLFTLIAKRIALGIATLFAVSVILFGSIEALPGDVAEEILGQDATEETVANLRRDLGLDVPAHLRYFAWIGKIAQGDLGRSVATKREVSSLIAPRIRNTLWLAALAALISIPLALSIGILAAVYRNSIFDKAINLVALIGLSLPEFLVSYILLLWFSVTFQIFPSISNVSQDIGFGTLLYRTILPALALSIIITAYMSRMTRAAILTVLANPYIQMARLKGIPAGRIIVRHALPNALAPVINVVALSLAHLVVGVVVIEVVFSYPGAGQLLVDSVSRRDITVVQACSLFFATTYIGLNFISDVLAIVTNPRLLHPR
jgi:peptide/nickel transport system permease protein